MAEDGMDAGFRDRETPITEPREHGFTHSTDEICRSLIGNIATRETDDDTFDNDTSTFDMAFLAFDKQTEPLPVDSLSADNRRYHVYRTLSRSDLPVEDVALLFGADKGYRNRIHSSESTVAGFKPPAKVLAMWEGIDGLSEEQRRVLLLSSARNEIARTETNIDYATIIEKTQPREADRQRIESLRGIVGQLKSTSSTTPVTG